MMRPTYRWVALLGVLPSLVRLGLRLAIGVLALARPTDPLPDGRGDAGEAGEVAILVCARDEPEELLTRTLRACRQVAGSRTVLVDDGREADQATVAAACGVDHVRVPPSTSLGSGKARALNAALDSVAEPFVVVLDADHVPSPRLVTSLRRGFTDSSVAVVQGIPGIGSVAEVGPALGSPVLPRRHRRFFVGDARRRDALGAGLWVGTTAMLRADAVREIGGFGAEAIAEDLLTSVRLECRGWRIRFVPEVLSWSPRTTAAGEWLQKAKWADGELEVLRLERHSLLGRDGGGLTRRQRLCYAELLSAWPAAGGQAAAVSLLAWLLPSRWSQQVPVSVLSWAALLAALHPRSATPLASACRSDLHRAQAVLAVMIRRSRRRGWRPPVTPKSVGATTLRSRLAAAAAPALLAVGLAHLGVRRGPGSSGGRLALAAALVFARASQRIP